MHALKCAKCAHCRTRLGCCRKTELGRGWEWQEQATHGSVKWGRPLTNTLCQILPSHIPPILFLILRLCISYALLGWLVGREAWGSNPNPQIWVEARDQSETFGSGADKNLQFSMNPNFCSTASFLVFLRSRSGGGFKVMHDKSYCSVKPVWRKIRHFWIFVGHSTQNMNMKVERGKRQVVGFLKTTMWKLPRRWKALDS